MDAPIAPKKRTASVAGVEGRPHKQTKRRASKACQSCRARKVRCNVVEQSPCTNCRLDEVECIISESKRKRKASLRAENENQPQQHSTPHLHLQPQLSPTAWSSSPRRLSVQMDSHNGHVPHPLYRTHGNRPTTFTNIQRPNLTNIAWPQQQLPELITNQPAFNPTLMSPALSDSLLPDYVKPLPSRLGHDETAFLLKKGALALPSNDLRNALLQSFVEHVDPFMPILELEELLQVIEAGDGSRGQISLLVFQAILFTASAFVDMQYLRRAGYATRKDARRAFYTRTRLLYDFDYESDRVSLVQTLLMMTYWYESPDDQKDTWHWMGLAISTGQTIGLNRNPARLEGHRRRQWRRIAWTLLIRDRVIALGMRKVPRVSMAEFDVSMLTLDDFEMKALSAELSCISIESSVARDLGIKKNLANLFIAQAQLALCIGRVLSTQYSASEQSMNEEGSARTSDTLVPKHEADEAAVTESCNQELDTWLSGLPVEAKPVDESSNTNTLENDAIAVNRALLHMIYHTTLSALHRPQASQISFGVKGSTEAEKSAEIVHAAARQTTTIVQGLLRRNLARFLPTTGVTVILPAITSHIMDVKSPTAKTRRTGLTNFCHCIQLMARLRDIYAAADFTIRLIELAIRKANIDIPVCAENDESVTFRKATCVEDLVAEGLRRRYVHAINGAEFTSTPPPDKDDENDSIQDLGVPLLPESEVTKHVELFLSTLPSAPSDTSSMRQYTPMTAADLDRDFESLIDINKIGDALNYGDTGYNAIQGESSGFTFDLDWIHSMSAGPISAVDANEDVMRAQIPVEDPTHLFSRVSSVPLDEGVAPADIMMKGELDENAGLLVDPLAA